MGNWFKWSAHFIFSCTQNSRSLSPFPFGVVGVCFCAHFMFNAMNVSNKAKHTCGKEFNLEQVVCGKRQRKRLSDCVNASWRYVYDVYAYVFGIWMHFVNEQIYLCINSICVRLNECATIGNMCGSCMQCNIFPMQRSSTRWRTSANGFFYLQHNKFSFKIHNK